jgi:hypothetical protein
MTMNAAAFSIDVGLDKLSICIMHISSDYSTLPRLHVIQRLRKSHN